MFDIQYLHLYTKKKVIKVQFLVFSNEGRTPPQVKVPGVHKSHSVTIPPQLRE